MSRSGGVLRIEIVHFNHRLRDESGEEEEFVAGLAAELQARLVPLFFFHFF
jgi:tRNA(Ile)-lysidine synthase TilS/MesJ